jgi:uncharacterized protein YyaL (SSP411 family)
VADALNSKFIPIKVDREERPDVDAVYMEAVQMMSGSGGWPLTVLATADGRPFWAGTYLPKNNFLRLLRQVADLWATRRDALEGDADRLAEGVRHGAELLSHLGEAEAGDSAVADAGASDEAATKAPRARLLYRARAYGAGPGALALAAEGILARRDPEWGGSAGAPKFPQPATLEVLARQWWRSGQTEALGALRRSLDAMSSGGIYDHLAGGFARYSTDRRWLVPHFEKMLYDNALLVRAYTHAWQLTGDARYRQVVEETVGYLLSPPLRLTEGAWASAEDADSEGEEGRFYAWSKAEVVEVAGPEVAEWYGATEAGNWEGKNILWRAGLGDVQRSPIVEQGRRRLLERRSQRARPGLDGKVLTEWNAMAIAALAGAGTAFDQPTWVAAASATAELLLARLRRPDGRWLRSWRPGPGPGGGEGPPARHLAYAGDYAWLVEAFTALGEATGARAWTDAAREAASGLADLFWDQDGGGFFTYGHDGEQLIARLKDLYDGAVPSANAVAAGALARLAELTGEEVHMDMAQRTVQVTEGAFGRAPAAFPGTALVADYLSEPRRQVVVASTEPDLVRPVWERYLPDTVLAWGEPYPSPLWEGRTAPDSAGLAFVCEGFACKLPVRGADQLAAVIDQRPR